MKFEIKNRWNGELIFSAEVFFTLIKKGDTPEKSKWSKQAVEWIDEWTESITKAFGNLRA